VKKLSLFFNPNCLNKPRIYKPAVKTLADISKFLLEFCSIAFKLSEEVGGGRKRET